MIRETHGSLLREKANLCIHSEIDLNITGILLFLNELLILYYIGHKIWYEFAL